LTKIKEMDPRKVLTVEEKYISRSYFKDEHKVGDASIPSKRSSNFNSKNNVGRKPAEVFRTDFITAMKIPDSQPLPAGCKTIDLKDTWRQEWEKGVQVPVNSVIPHVPKFRDTGKKIPYNSDVPFKLPEEFIKFDSKKYIESIDRSSTSCNYDLDDIDMQWLKSLSQCRTLKKVGNIDELTMERAITYFERQCFDKMAHAVQTKEGLSIEYDENTTCNVCLSPDAEDGNEIIFCDACNMCVHQHCYGVPDIPEGNWLCNPCSRGILAPPCCLCPNKTGAMKRIKDSYEWIHVICAWWIPEVKIEDSKYIERITKDKIPSNRWHLSCYICREKGGACVQCSVKRCVRAYHVTCAVKDGLEMKTVIVPAKDDVQHISFCSKHCVPVPPDENPNRNNKSGEDFENNRLKELRKLESEFYLLITVVKSAKKLSLSKEAVRKLHSYWTMKRRANGNAPLIKLTLEQQEKLSGKQGLVFINQQKTLEMERFLHLRQDLERLRNLCYMIVRREKMRKELHRTSKEIFYKQNDIVLEEEDVTDETLDFLRHRTTRFSNFSEFYRTEREYEEESGVKISLFDETFEESAPLLNNSQMEVLNPQDLERRSPDGKKAKASKNATVFEKKSERNIFDVLEPCKESKLNNKPPRENGIVDDCSDKARNSELDNETSNHTVNIDLNHALSDTKNSTNMEKEKPISPVNGKLKKKVKHKSLREKGNLFDSIHKLTNDLLTQNGIDSEIDDEVLFRPIKEESNDVTPLPNNSTPSKKSKLVKKGKKRFRNLHNSTSTFVCRNSPRFNKSSNSNASLPATFNACSSDTQYTTDEQEHALKDNPVKKRRRLDSSDVCASEVNNKTSFTRVTRSRVSSCS